MIGADVDGKVICGAIGIKVGLGMDGIVNDRGVVDVGGSITVVKMVIVNNETDVDGEAVVMVPVDYMMLLIMVGVDDEADVEGISDEVDVVAINDNTLYKI